MNWKATTQALATVICLVLAAGCGPMADPSTEEGRPVSPQGSATLSPSATGAISGETNEGTAILANESNPSSDATEGGDSTSVSTDSLGDISAIGASGENSPELSTERSARVDLATESARQAPPERPFERPTPAVEEAPAARSAFQFPGRQPKQQDLTFDDLKFPMEKGGPFDRSMLTEKIEALAGKEIKIRGYMLPAFQQSGITNFILVRDNQECCFGPGAALYDCIRITMDPGTSTDYSVRPIAVKGIFEIEPFVGPDGKHLAIFHMRASDTTGG